MAADVWAAGGAGALSATLTTSLNSSAYDRLLVIHVAPNTTAINITLDDGTRKFANATPLAASVPVTFGPFFLPNGTSLRGGADTANGDYRIDELRVNQ